MSRACVQQTYFFSVLLPSDEDFQKQYARAIDLWNDAWAD
jgi:hypothetical protein